MNNKKNWIISVIIFVLLLATYFILQNKDEKKSDVVSNKKIEKVVDTKTDKIDEETKVEKEKFIKEKTAPVVIKKPEYVFK